MSEHIFMQQLRQVHAVVVAHKAGARHVSTIADAAEISKGEAKLWCKLLRLNLALDGQKPTDLPHRETFPPVYYMELPQ